MERLWNGEKRKCFSRQTWKKIDNDQIELVIKCVRCRRSTVWKLVTCRINYVHLMSIRSDEVGLWTRMAMIFAFRVSSGNKTKPSAHRPNRIKECHTINSTWFHWTDRNAIQIFRCWISAAPAKYVEIEISKDVFMLYIDTRPFPLFKLQNIPHIQSVSMANALSSFNALREALNMGSTCLSIHHLMYLPSRSTTTKWRWFDAFTPKINYVVSIYSTGIDYCAGTLMMFPSPSDSVRMIEFEYNLPIDFCKVKIPTNIQIAFRSCVCVCGCACMCWAMVMAPIAHTCQ